MASRATAAGIDEVLRSLAPLDEAEVEAGKPIFRMRRLARGATLLRAGDPATEIAIVTRGLLREYFVTPRGVERTKAFIVEGQASGSFADLLSATGSRAFIVADEPASLQVARYVDVRALTRRLPGWAALERAVLERTLAVKARAGMGAARARRQRARSGFPLPLPGPRDARGRTSASRRCTSRGSGSADAPPPRLAERGDVLEYRGDYDLADEHTPGLESLGLVRSVKAGRLRANA